MTALHVAVKGVHLDAVRVLLAKGVDVNWASLPYARKSPHMLALLKSYQKLPTFEVFTEESVFSSLLSHPSAVRI